MVYVGYDGLEYLDLEALNMRRDSRESQRQARAERAWQEYCLIEAWTKLRVTPSYVELQAKAFALSLEESTS